MPVDFSAFNLDTIADPEAGVDGQWAQWGAGLCPYDTPSVALRLGPESEGVPTGWLNLHPGPGEEPTVLRWQAPAYGPVEIKGQFLPGDSGIMQVAVRQGSNFLWQAVDCGTFDLITSIEAGQTIDFTVFGGYGFGATPLEAVIYYSQTNAPPTIYRQPVSQTHIVGDTAQLDIIAVGSWPLAYQWFKDAAALSGQTNAVLILTNLALTDVGNYTVVVTNAFGSVTSAAARLKVAHRPMQTFVSAQSTNPMWPYESWAMAATNIQDAIDVIASGGQVVVSNGMYPGDVSVTKPVALLSVNGPEVTVIDGGGPCVLLVEGASLAGFTLTNGYCYWGEGAGVWCDTTNAFVTNCVIAGNVALDGGGACGCTLYGCTLENNSAVGRWFDFPARGYYVASHGGGTYGSILYNCALVHNDADYGGGAYAGALYNCTLTDNFVVDHPGWPVGLFGVGGGAFGSMLHNCTLTHNSGWFGGGTGESTLYNCTLTHNLSHYGGGAGGSTLYNCTVTSNSADWGGGGAGESTLYNCTLTGNSAAEEGGGVCWSTLNNCIVYFNNDGGNCAGCTLSYCCTTPDPGGIGNITNAPLFVDYTFGNLRLQSNSPCINAGNNANVTTALDLAGNPRVVSGTVDIGAYEYQGTGSRISYAWLQQYGFATDGSADFIDLDVDGHNNWQEWLCGTCPTNSLSALRMVSAVPGADGVTVNWQSVAGINYFVECSTNLSASPCFRSVATNVVGYAGLTSYAHTNAIGSSPFFYRVGVQCP